MVFVEPYTTCANLVTRAVNMHGDKDGLCARTVAMKCAPMKTLKIIIEPKLLPGYIFGAKYLFSSFSKWKCCTEGEAQHRQTT